jgi:hypothetical protein
MPPLSLLLGVGQHRTQDERTKHRMRARAQKDETKSDGTEHKSCVRNRRRRDGCYPFGGGGTEPGLR